MFVPAEIIIKNGNTEWWNLCIWEFKKKLQSSTNTGIFPDDSLKNIFKHIKIC